jgi:signal transduction histidine kinase
LIVDDEPINLQLLAEALHADYRVKVATNGPAALALARLVPAPEVILLDLRMPEMDGYAVCAALKREPATAAIPVLFITSQTDPVSETVALNAGAADYIRKPIDPMAVRARVRVQCELARYRYHLEDLVHTRTLDLAQARDAAESTNRAKSAFLANVSHEMHTPLNRIEELAYLLSREVPDGWGRERLAQIEQTARHLLDLVNNLLDLAQIESGQIRIQCREFDLPELLDEVVLVQDSRDQIAAKGLKFVREIDPAVPNVLTGDPARLRQVLDQLLSNAVKFSEQGRIVLRVQPREAGAERLSVRFEVQDQGIGISPAVRSELFQRFNQGDNSLTRKFGGTGLGLVLCQRLVALMGGEIDLVGTPGRGTTVGFWVPFGVGGV